MRRLRQRTRRCRRRNKAMRYACLAITFAMAAGMLMSLGGCAAAVVGISVAAGVSTLLKNEANCSLVDVSACTLPHIRLPVVEPAR